MTSARISWDADEALVSPAASPRRVSWDADEVLVSPAASPRRVSWDADEVLVSPAEPLRGRRVSAFAVEVLLPTTSSGPTVTFNRREGAAWTPYTGVPKAWDGSAWVDAPGSYWNGSAWVALT